MENVMKIETQLFYDSYLQIITQNKKQQLELTG